MKKHYAYMLRCKDNSIYTGITTDLERRFEEHSKKTVKCAKYALNHDVDGCLLKIIMGGWRRNRWEVFDEKKSFFVP
mgnify:CR=1 FL=1